MPKAQLPALLLIHARPSAPASANPRAPGEPGHAGSGPEAPGAPGGEGEEGRRTLLCLMKRMEASHLLWAAAFHPSSGASSLSQVPEISELLMAPVSLGRLSQKSCSYQKPPPSERSEKPPRAGSSSGEATVCSAPSRAANAMLHGRSCKPVLELRV